MKSQADELTQKSGLGFTPVTNFVNCNTMKRTALILTGLTMAILGSGWDCDKTKHPVQATDFDVSAIVTNSKGQPAIVAVSFWEDQEFVIDTFVLAKDSHGYFHDNLTHLYVQEFIPLKVETVEWQEFPEDFKACNEFLSASSNGSWASPGDYTRRVGTGAGLVGKRRTDTVGCAFEVRLCGHRKAITYAIQ